MAYKLLGNVKHKRSVTTTLPLANFRTTLLITNDCIATLCQYT